MLNQCQFIGNLGRDPEIRTTQQGKKIANLRLAVTSKWKDQAGQRQERTEWVSIAVFSDGLCKIAEQYLRKGSKIYVSGEMNTRKWQDQEGKDRYSTEIILGRDGKIVMLGDRPSGQERQRQEEGPSGVEINYVSDDDIPF